MTLVLSSFLLSPGVFVRMIVPVIVIGIASTLVWALLNILTAGYASTVSEPITAALISLFGIRVALELKGDGRRVELSILILKAVLYGMFFFILNAGLVGVVTLATALFSLWQVGDGITLSTIKEAAESTQVAFSLIWLGSNTIAVILVLSIIQAVMAVPLASAAREASQRAPSQGFFNGIGRSFLPLLCMFFLSFFLQIYFGLFAVLYALFPLVLSVISIFVAQSLPDFDPEFLLKGIGATAGLLWLNAWIWSASALALLKFDGGPAPQASPTPSAEAISAADIRALRKSRE